MSGVEDGNAEVLLAVFRFKNRRPSATQTEVLCKKLRDTLGECVRVVTSDGDEEESDGFRPAPHLDPLQDDRATPLDVFTPRERTQLSRGWSELFNKPSGEVGAVWTLAWFPQYAGVLQVEQLGVDSVALRVLGLDNWTLTRHFLPGGECAHSAVPTEHALLNCGSLARSSLPEFTKRLSEVLAEAKQCTGERRSAVSSRESSIGHQKTPQFLVASVRTALGKLEGGSRSSHAPRGGMTDVGQHTGGAPRDTCWPLVCAAMRQALQAHSVLANKLLLVFYRRLLDNAMEELADSRQSMGLFWRRVDTCFEMLETLVIQVTQLVDEAYDGTQWLDVCQRYRARLDAAVSAWNQANAQHYRLPPGIATRQLPKLLPPDQKSFADRVASSGDTNDDAYSMLGHEHEFFNGCSNSITKLMQQLRSVTTQDRAKTLFGLRAVETFMFKISAILGASTASLDDISPERLLQLMTWYRDHQDMENCGDDLWRVQQQSVYLLLSWIAFCVAHVHCCTTFADVARFKIVLNWQRLEVCVLKERRAREALKRVARYIHDWNQTATAPALFDLNDHAGTLALARLMGDTRHQTTYDQIQQQWFAGCQATWLRIAARKEELRVVREEIKQKESELHSVNSHLEAEKERLRRDWDATCAANGTPHWHYPRNLGSSVTKSLNGQIRRLKHLLSQATARRHRLLIKSELLVSPLPREKADALSVLFLVDPPNDIDVLAELCWRAQRTLRASSVSVAPDQPCSTTWRQHVELYGRVKFSPAARHGIAHPLSLPVPTSFGPATIDEVSSLESLMSSSTWYPSATGLAVSWCYDGSGNQWVNPFSISASDSREDFTVCLPQSRSSFDWQWAVEYPDESALTRGNIAYAFWGTCCGADKNEGTREFFSRGALRAYPHQQLRQIFADVEADSMSWSDPIVSILARHALYQVGNISTRKAVDSSGQPLTRVSLDWHCDLEDETAVGDFCAMVARLVDELSHSPRRWQCVPLLGEFVASLSQFTTEANRLTKALAQMTRCWAEQVRKSWQREGIPDDERKELRVRECVLYGSAALCYHRVDSERNDIDNESIVELCELLVLFHNAKLFASGTEIRQIESHVDRMMADLIIRTVDYVESSPERSHILTHLCHLVNASVPENLNWAIVPASDHQLRSCWFTALDSETRTTCFVNLYTGLVILNGSHPSGLPAAIRQLPLYQQLFKDRDFDVTCFNKVYTATSENLQSRRYSFFVDARNTELLVEEQGPACTLQLGSQKWRERFAKRFPRRLSELYQHWFWIDRCVVLLRPHRAKDTDVYFVVVLEPSGHARCYEVPRSDRALPYDWIVQRVDKYPVFVVADRQLLRVFSKLEEIEYIHAMEYPTEPRPLEIQLPRFGLRFIQNPDGRFTSVDHRGFVLNQLQQLDSGQMPRFAQYLVLERDDRGTATTRLIIPFGPVESRGCQVSVNIPDDASASVASSAFDEHSRLGVFVPSSIEAQLQLAAIYAASGSLVPWNASGVTGGEAALQLLRGCTPSRPFSSCAMAYLKAIATRFSFRTPVLTLMVSLLLEKSNRLAFLFNLPTEDDRSVDISDALDEYRHRVGRSAFALVYPRRQLLTLAEERDLLQSKSAVENIHAKVYVSSSTVGEAVVPQEVGAVHSVSVHELSSSCVTCAVPPVTLTIPPFPLSPRGSNKMSECMIGELRESWNAFHRHNVWASLSVSRAAFKLRVREKLGQVQASQTEALAVLKESLARARGSPQDKLLEVIGRYSTLTLADVMQSVLDDNELLQLSPNFTTTSRQQWKEWSLLLLELCVMEDKLKRLLQCESDAKILEELQTVKRAWEPSEYPSWLVFEVEGCLEIRHEQFVIAKHLIDNPGSICQLNMGRGKTRVILPMLFLYYSYHSQRSSHGTGARLARAHFLSPLLSETREFMWRVLTSGALRMPFIELPFNRSFSLGNRELRLMNHVIDEAKRNGGVVMVAPEHRLSLELKRVEMSSSSEGNPTVALLDAVFQPENFVDIFDESDALLHHGYHLVYAVGESVPLDGGSDRWLTAQALLRVLVRDKSTRVKEVLKRYPDMWSFQPEYRERRGGTSGGGIYNGFRLNATNSDAADCSNDAEAGDRVALRRAMLEDLIDQAPFDCEWLRFFKCGGRSARNQLIRLLTDPTIDLTNACDRLPPVIQHRKHQVLAFRGLLAFFVLDNCLEKRYRVEYGHPVPGSRPKLIAIPFQAADLPSERSEFSHPDAGIVLTLLSFYHSGLRDDQLHRTFEVLLGLDEAESERYYAEWFTSIKASLDNPTEREMLASLQHISLDNAHQFAAVCDTYRYSIEVANFYLNFCVFPSDTRQFPCRLSRSAWDLVRGSTNIGFSGTNDTHHLLPLAVKQREPEEPTLRGTNGKMIQLLMDSTRGYEKLIVDEKRRDGASESSIACWQALLVLALEKQCHALIDTGALLAGVSNHEAAQFLMGQSHFAAQGVTYYDTRSEFDCWVVLEKERNIVQRQKNATLQECDTFVIFDEARSRGSDMKLLPTAVALLTLGPKITKDKFMQGAGRLRQLGKHQQTLWITSTLEVYNSMTRQSLDADAVTPVHVLNWVMDNTQRQCTLGRLEWAQSGIQFHAKEADVKYEQQEDDWTLEGQYAGAQSMKSIAEIIQYTLSAQAEVVVTRQASVETAWNEIRRCGEVFGSQDKVAVSGFGEECERELQIEEEQQEVHEIIRYTVKPCTETPWAWGSLLRCSSVDQLQCMRIGVEIVSVERAARAWLKPRECCDIAWGTGKVYATQNFWLTVEAPTVVGRSSSTTSSFAMNACLRRVDAMVVFPDGSVLLLSEFEADAVIKLLQTSRVAGVVSSTASGGSFGFVHLAFAVGFLGRLKDASPLSVPVSQVPLALGWSHGEAVVPSALQLPFTAIMVCRLLNGDTDLFVDSPADVSERALRSLLQPLRNREETLQSFVSLRGFTTRWKRSWLHTITKRMDLEDAAA